MTKMPIARKKPKDAYHHGDLRPALISAALREVERSGAEAVSIKSLASGLGVSQPAPYRHFTDREALLIAVALDGFHAFSESLRDAGSTLEAIANAYVEFGVRRASLYRLMFTASLLASRSASKELRAAADDCFSILLAPLQASLGGRAHPAAAALWASLHGLVMLETESFLAGANAGAPDLRALVRAVCANAK